MDKKGKNPYGKLKLFKEFTKNEDCIVFLLRLKNGNLATCSQDKEINIYEKNTFNLLFSWSGHLNSINSICELNDSRLVSCSDDRRISIWNYDIKKKEPNQEIIFIAHTSFINKIITLTDNNIASCSHDNNIFIWNTQPPYNRKCSLIGHKSEVTSIIQLKNKKIISVTGKKDGMMKIWTLDETNDNIIKQESVVNTFCHCSNSLVEIDNNKVVIGAYEIIRIVNVKRKQIEAIIECHSNSLISSITVLNNGCIVSACEEGNIAIINPIFYDNLKTIELAHDMMIFSLCTLSNKSFCSSSKDGTIKVWTF